MLFAELDRLHADHESRICAYEATPTMPRPPQVTIRERSAEDLAALVAVAGRVRDVDNYPMHLPNGDFERFLHRPEPIAAWVAEADRLLIGHVAMTHRTSPPVMRLVATLGPELPPVYVARLLVDPGARRRGVGQRLLTHAHRAARDAGRCAFLDVVDIPRSQSAIRLYRRLGWEEVGRVPFQLAGDSADELVFKASTSVTSDNSSAGAAYPAPRQERVSNTSKR